MLVALYILLNKFKLKLVVIFNHYHYLLFMFFKLNLIYNKILKKKSPYFILRLITSYIIRNFDNPHLNNNNKTV